MTQNNRTDELDKETETYLDYFYFSDLDEDVLEDLEEDDEKNDNSSGK